jgi:choline dehydrogenase-like flavoprotein
MNTQQYDIAIIGGGPVGAALALALRGSSLKVCVLEARPENTASNDARALALSYGSRLLLARLGVWDTLHHVSAIRTIHISQKQSFGRAVLHAAEMNVPELGYVLPYTALQDALTRAVAHPSPASGESVARGAKPAGGEGGLAQRCVLAGGDDYELCFTASAARHAELLRISAKLDLPLTRIGKVVAGHSCIVHDAAGVPLNLESSGYDHFR